MNGLDGTVGDLMTLPRSQYSVMERGGFQGLWKDSRLPGCVFFGEGNPLAPGSAIIVHSALMHGAPPLPSPTPAVCSRAPPRRASASSMTRLVREICRAGATARGRRQAALLHRLVLLPAVRLPGPQVARGRQRPLDRQAPRPAGRQIRPRLGHEQVLRCETVVLSRRNAFCNTQCGCTAVAARRAPQRHVEDSPLTRRCDPSAHCTNQKLVVSIAAQTLQLSIEVRLRRFCSMCGDILPPKST